MSDHHPSEEIVRSRKQALQRVREAEDAVRTATEKRQRTESLLIVELKYAVTAGRMWAEERRKGDDPKDVDRAEKELGQLDEEEARRIEEWKKADEEETHALRELVAALKEFGEATVEPRVEAEKLRFEEYKLRATLSSASIVGIAATVGLLLPARPAYVTVLGIAFVCLFVSTVLALAAMKEISEHVESTMISSTLKEPGRLRTWLTRHAFTMGLLVFAIFVVLNLIF